MQENYVTGGLLQFALRELSTIIRAPRLWGTFFVVVLIFTVTGPFGTDQSMPVAVRFFYWLSVQFAGWSTAIAFSVLADAFLAPFFKHAFARMMAGAVVAALPIGLWIGFIGWGFSGRTPTVSAVLANASVALPLSALFCILAYMTLRRELESVQADVTHTPPLLARLKPGNRGAILRLSAEDHYTRIVTSRGEELLLLRFSDAVNEVGNTSGLQIHRSHWVADRHVAELRKANGGLSLLTKDSTLLPVSRASGKSARERFGSVITSTEKAEFS
ncbi:LytTR family DNA-binding domain-containing protein [Brucella intermedia]|uniref:LytTR family DNA-binding domain-containing protein n=1 Tax=Brucella intermedia TaxID=94625 RepID=UPI00124E109A|nr:LytTR family DNA-binding domain-containing protein [Brucella intermedia]KAB2733757.1 response regulator transcription factor [Brucella intermedia]